MVIIISGDIMKKKFLIIMLCILSIVLCINLVSLIFPINRIGITKKVEQCREIGIISDVSNDYVTRNEFLESFLKCVGMSEDTLDEMISIVPYVPVIDDYINPYPYYSSGDKEEVEKAKEMDRYNGLCKTIVYLDAMQAYEIKPDRYEFRGSDYITLNEAVSMIEACLTDFETDSGKFDKNSREYMTLLLKSRIDGILLPCDLLYWSFTDTKLTQEDMVVLLYRLSNKKRYKYISDEKSNYFPIDENRSMTYYEYLTTNK